jgi:hypothetical protein
LSRIAAFLDIRLVDVNATLTSIQDMNAQSIDRLDTAEIRIIAQQAGDCLVRMGYAQPEKAQ